MTEGIATVACAVLVSFLIADFPEEAKWLSDDERAFVKARLSEDTGESQLETQSTWRDVLSVLKDLKIILGGLTYFGLVVPGYASAYFAPTILLSLGYSPVKTQLYSVPLSTAAFGLSMAVAIASDHFKRRYIFVVPVLSLSVIGMIILLNVHDSVSVRYGALFLVSMGQAAAAPILVCWFSTNRESTPRILPFPSFNAFFQKSVDT